MTCVHFWKLADDLVENVPATCRHCGEERVFPGGVPLTTQAMYSSTARPHNEALTMASRRRGGQAVAKMMREKAE